MLQEVLSGFAREHERAGKHADAAGGRISSPPMNEVSAATGVATDRVERKHHELPRRHHPRPSTTSASWPCSFDAHGRDLAKAAELVDSSKPAQRRHHQRAPRPARLAGLPRSDIRTEDLEQRLKRFSGPASNESLEVASTRAPRRRAPRGVGKRAPKARAPSATSSASCRKPAPKAPRARRRRGPCCSPMPAPKAPAPSPTNMTAWRGKTPRKSAARTAEAMRSIYEQSAGDTPVAVHRTPTTASPTRLPAMKADGHRNAARAGADPPHHPARGWRRCASRWRANSKRPAPNCAVACSIYRRKTADSAAQMRRVIVDQIRGPWPSLNRIVAPPTGPQPRRGRAGASAAKSRRSPSSAGRNNVAPARQELRSGGRGKSRVKNRVKSGKSRETESRQESRQDRQETPPRPVCRAASRSTLRRPGAPAPPPKRRRSARRRPWPAVAGCPICFNRASARGKPRPAREYPRGEQREPQRDILRDTPAARRKNAPPATPSSSLDSLSVDIARHDRPRRPPPICGTATSAGEAQRLHAQASIPCRASRRSTRSARSIAATANSS